MSRATILNILWGVYSVCFGVLGIYLVDENPQKDTIFLVFALAAQLVLGAWAFLSAVINVVVLEFTDKRFKIPPPKRFSTKQTPIYKLESWDKKWSVTKYELQWCENWEHPSSWLIPFSSFFVRFKYVDVGEYVFDYDLEGITDIGMLWEKRFTEVNIEISAKKTEEQKRTDKIAELNKTFLENYE